MSLAIPDWMPLWAQVLLLGFGIVVLVAFLLMPFAVYGVKGRLSEIALQLEDARADRSYAITVANLSYFLTADIAVPSGTSALEVQTSVF